MRASWELQCPRIHYTTNAGIAMFPNLYQASIINQRVSWVWRIQCSALWLQGWGYRFMVECSTSILEVALIPNT